MKFFVKMCRKKCRRSEKLTLPFQKQRKPQKSNSKKTTLRIIHLILTQNRLELCRKKYTKQNREYLMKTKQQRESLHATQHRLNTGM